MAEADCWRQLEGAFSFLLFFAIFSFFSFLSFLRLSFSQEVDTLMDETESSGMRRDLALARSVSRAVLGDAGSCLDFR